MFRKCDQESLQHAYSLVNEMNLGPAGEGMQPVGKPVIVTMDLPGASTEEDEHDYEDNHDDHDEHDHSEMEMAASEIHRIIKFAPIIQKHLESMDGLEGWVAAKLTKAADYISGIYNWLDYKQSQQGCGCGEDQDMFNMGYEDEESNEEDCEYAQRGCKCGGCPDCQ